MWCENNNILSEAQFAYKAGYGTTDAIFVPEKMSPRESLNISELFRLKDPKTCFFSTFTQNQTFTNLTLTFEYIY